MDADNDEFRKVEKMIRRMISLAKNKKGKSRRNAPGIKNTCKEALFNSADIVDYKKLNSRIVEFCSGVSGNSDSAGPRIIQIEGLPTGFYIIVGALSTSKQMFLSKIALEEYSQAEHTNLSNLGRLSGKSTGLAVLVETTAVEKPSESLSNLSLISNSTRDIWQQSVEDDDNFERFRNLRWASLGYHYDWTKRMYQENLKSTFPTYLVDLCKYLAGLVGEKMEAEAAIVNFYPIGTYMSGHIDDAEHAMDEPIISISLGCPAIFLIGGKNKNEKPTPILIRSGDVIVMSKDSRYAYHGIPGVVSHNFHHDIVHQQCKRHGMTSTFDESCCDICHLIHCENRGIDCVESNNYVDNLLMTNSLVQHHDVKSPQINENKDNPIIVDPVLQYLKQGRININVRRVAQANVVWVDKRGSGAAYAGT